ncbi:MULTISPECIES: hypothetical protein [Vibrio]|uniref:hypothetical protein n=1 Tax=Vibrio TaxID=662 RepID=UPI000C821C99|nr:MULTISPECIES: hypothetical protein [Vibrio]PMI76099.1 hypothetical protein BCU38_07930 [Vibrio splendidus]
MKNDIRLIQFFDLTLIGKTRATSVIVKRMASPVTLARFYEQLESLRELKKSTVRVSKKSPFEFRLEDIKDNGDHYILMMNVVDTSAAHVVTQELGGDETTRQTTRMSDRRGLESSSHLILHKTPNAAGQHLVLFERSQGINFFQAIRFLRRLAQIAAKHFVDEYTKPHPNNEAGKTFNVYCDIDFVGHPSDDFKDELENGTINNIAITSNIGMIRGYDVKKHTYLKDGVEIKMDVSKPRVVLNGGNLGHLKRGLADAKSLSADYVKVSFTDETGASKTATLDPATGQLIGSEKYVKTRKITGFGKSLPTSFSVINDNIVLKILALD